MNINKTAKEASGLWKDYKRSNPIMLRKSFSMRDAFYRKNSPSKELWHTEVSFDIDQYLVIVALIAILVGLCLICRRATKRMSRCRRKRH